MKQLSRKGKSRGLSGKEDKERKKRRKGEEKRICVEKGEIELRVEGKRKARKIGRNRKREREEQKEKEQQMKKKYLKK